MTRALGGRESLRVGVIGHGAIGRPVAEALARGQVDGAVLAGVLVRGEREDVPAPVRDLAALAAASDLVVEAAGHGALRDHAEPVLAAGVDLLVVSVGALADPSLRHRLGSAGPGRLWICAGAVGGLDLVRTVACAGELSVRLTSTKRPTSLIRPWMDQETVAALQALRAGSLVVFDGSAADAAVQFPTNANVAATLALAAGDWDAVTVRLVADPEASVTEHRIEIDGVTGSYELVIRNYPSPDNPASSAVVSHSLLRCLADRTGRAAFPFA